MNRKEKDAVCALIAEWEFSSGGSSSEASARASCARDLARDLALSAEHLSLYRAWEIGNIIGDQSEAALDFLTDAIGDDYAHVLDMLDDGTLAAAIRSREAS